MFPGPFRVIYFKVEILRFMPPTFIIWTTLWRIACDFTYQALLFFSAQHWKAGWSLGTRLIVSYVPVQHLTSPLIEKGSFDVKFCSLALKPQLYRSGASIFLCGTAMMNWLAWWWHLFLGACSKRGWSLPTWSVETWGYKCLQITTFSLWSKTA